MSLLRDRFTVEILYNISIVNNITYLHIFYNDQHILHYMANVDVFKDATIEKDEHGQSLQAATNDKKGNIILKGVVSLEKLYDFHDHFQE